MYYTDDLLVLQHARAASELAPHCAACGDLKHLDLKIVVHRGKILIHEVMARQEISGPPVIVAHGLLSAACDVPSRILVTDRVGVDINLPFPTNSHTAIANVDEMGSIGLRVIVFNPALMRSKPRWGKNVRS